MPSEKEPEPKLYRMRVFAKNEVLAKSKFWYHMKRQHKVRKIDGEIVSVAEVCSLISQSLDPRKAPRSLKELRHCAKIFVKN